MSISGSKQKKNLIKYLMNRLENMVINTDGLLERNYIKLILIKRRATYLISLKQKLEENFKLF